MKLNRWRCQKAKERADNYRKANIWVETSGTWGKAGKCLGRKAYCQEF